MARTSSGNPADRWIFGGTGAALGHPDHANQQQDNNGKTHGKVLRFRQARSRGRSPGHPASPRRLASGRKPTGTPRASRTVHPPPRLARSSSGRHRIQSVLCAGFDSEPERADSSAALPCRKIIANRLQVRPVTGLRHQASSPAAVRPPPEVAHVNAHTIAHRRPLEPGRLAVGDFAANDPAVKIGWRDDSP